MRGLFVRTFTLLALLISINASYGQLENIEQDKECKRNAKVLRRKIKAKKNTHIPCCITGHPFPEITWYKDESELSMPNGSTVINNVIYQRKGARLLISRTDVHGSGNYQCLARNSAGYERGQIYQVIFYESGKSTPKQSNVTKANHFEVLGGNFVENPNKTVNNEYVFISDNRNVEEEEDKEATYKENKESQSGETPKALIIGVVSASAVALLALVLIVIWFRKKHNSSTEQNAHHPTLVTTPHRRCGSWPAILCGGHKETVETQDESIDEKRVSICRDEFKPTCDVIAGISVFKEYKPETSRRYSSSSSLQSCSDATIGFNFSPQNIANTSSKKIPSVSSRSCCSSTIDKKKFSAHPCTFCSVHQGLQTELSVDIRNDDETGVSTTNRRRTSNMPSSSSSNTSELFDELEKIPPNANKRYFSSTFIEHSGGELVLTGTGIKLVVPEGAIDEGKTEVVKLALLDNPAYAPKEKDGDISLTPVVMCGPHGLRFKKHVMLVLPHCVAVSDELEENFRVLCSNTAPEIAPDWKEIFNNKDKPNKDVFCNMGQQQFYIFLRHFSWYTIHGEGRARNFSIQAYHTTLHQPNEEFKVRIYFVPILRDSNVGQKRVDDAEEKLHGTLSDARKMKIFHKKGGDIMVEAIEISGGWLVNQTIQTQSHKVLSVCREESPNHTFRFKHMTQRPEEISCTFIISQANCKFDSPVDISMSNHFKAEIRRAQIQKRNDNERQDLATSMSSGFSESVESMMTAAFITVKLQRYLSQLLDTDTFGVSNWKDLAERLGCDLKFIRWLDRRRIESPTEKLLMHWENTVDFERPEDALAFLQQKLCEIGRKDAAKVVKEHLRSQRKLSLTVSMV